MNKSEENIMINKLNRSEAKCRDLEEQIRIKEKQWKEAEASFNEAEFRCKTLCEEILVRDPEEMILGRKYSWDSLSMADMAKKALVSLRNYNSERTDLMRKLLDVAEERRLQVESLIGQLEVLKSCSADQPEITEATKDDVPPSTQESAVKQGDESETAHIDMIIEEDNDVTEADLDAIRDMETFVQELHPIQREIPVHPAKKIIREQQKRAEKHSMVHVIDLSVYKDKLTELMWRVLELIGKEGLSAYTEIESRINDMASDVTKATVRMSVRSLLSMGLLAQEQISDPIRSKFMVYRLSEIGHRLFKEHFGTAPVLSELDIIISQHDNPNHGYGILALAQILKESNKFDSVVTDRKHNTIKLRRGGTYIPDIIASIGNKKFYIEYECGTHVQSDFSAKCNKMLQVTNAIYIVTPNRDILQKRIMNQVAIWIKEKGGYRALAGKTVRMTTATALRHEDPLDELCWQVFYDMSSDTPIVQI